jgi:hypothetical protein
MNKLFTYIKATVLICLLISGANAANVGHDLSAEEATKLFSGKTVEGYNVTLGYWFKDYFNPNGRIREIHNNGSERQGKWRIDKRGQMCVQWIEGQEFCYILVEDGKVYKEIMIRENERKHIVTFEKFTEGNSVLPFK